MAHRHTKFQDLRGSHKMRVRSTCASCVSRNQLEELARIFSHCMEPSCRKCRHASSARAVGCTSCCSRSFLPHFCTMHLNRPSNINVQTVSAVSEKDNSQYNAHVLHGAGPLRGEVPTPNSVTLSRDSQTRHAHSRSTVESS